MLKRFVVASVVALATLFVGMSSGWTCSPAPASIDNVFPEDGAEIVPRPEFAIEYSGSGSIQDVALTDGSGTDVSVERTRSYSFSIFGEFAVYKPVNSLSQGDYELRVEVSQSSGGSETETKNYTVVDGGVPDSPPTPKELNLTTEDRMGDTCDSSPYRARVNFLYSAGALSKVGYFEVTFRENPVGEGGKEEKMMIAADQSSGNIEASEPLDFEPSCVSVDAVVPDGRSVSSNGSCGGTGSRDPGTACGIASGSGSLPSGGLAVVVMLGGILLRRRVDE